MLARVFMDKSFLLVFFQKELLPCFLVCTAASAEDYAQNQRAIPPAPLHEQVLRLPGDPDRPVELVVTLYTPEGPGPFPLAVMNHGASGTKERPEEMARYRYTYSAYYFLSRGYAVALPMARGFGGSGGRIDNYGCDLARFAIDNGRDIAGAIAALSARPEIDASRIVVAGQSFGGWNTLGLGSLSPPHVRGLIDFFGGVQSSGCRDGVFSAGASLAAAARQLGAQTSLPSLWIYGENDSLFPPPIWQPMFRLYSGAGGRAQLVDVGRFMDDSHQLLSHAESIPLWAPRVDAFLASIGLPSREVFPDYLPIPPPPPTHFAPIKDVAAVPGLSAAGRTNYETFLSQPWPRAFLLAPGGQAAASHGGFDPLGRAFALCRSAHLACTPYAIDDDVVWTGPARPRTPAPAGSGFASLTDVAAVPWVNAKGRAAYEHFLTVPLPRAFLIGTGGESIATQGGIDPLARGTAICAQAQITCRPYAVDNAVVWTRPAPPSAVPPASGFARLEDVAALPWVNDKGRAAYRQFLEQPIPRAFAVAPGGQTVATQGGYDPQRRALDLCAKHALTCRFYAVNNAVVWRP